MENKSQYDKILPFQVLAGNKSLPGHELVGAFKTRELAEDFIEYQATIDRKTRYHIEEISSLKS